MICALYLITSGPRSNQRHSAINEIGSNKIAQGILLREALITSLRQQFLIYFSFDGLLTFDYLWQYFMI